MTRCHEPASRHRFDRVCPQAGSRPGGRGTFLCFAKEKYPKERRPDGLGPSASLRATCGARKKWGRARTRLRLRQSLALIHFLLRSSAQPDGWGNEYGCGEAGSRKARPRRSPNPFPIPIPPPFCMRRGAQGQTDQDGRLSERSEFEPGPGWTEHRRLPSAASAKEGRRQQGRLFFGDFLLAKQKKVTCCRATPGLWANYQTTKR